MITLATLPNATAQEVFDQVAAHLLRQNKQSMTSHKVCKYRHGVLKCAAGCLIGDNEYSPKFEQNSWSTLADNHYVPAIHAPLIRFLQIVHDECAPSTWRSKLRGVADTYNLKWNPAFDLVI